MLEDLIIVILGAAYGVCAFFLGFLYGRLYERKRRPIHLRGGTGVRHAAYSVNVFTAGDQYTMYAVALTTD
jgi:hypothetical protein